jgi:hypothetical protein
MMLVDLMALELCAEDQVLDVFRFSDGNALLVDGIETSKHSIMGASHFPRYA